MLLSWFGIQAALAAPDRFGMLLAGGITTWFGVQAVINLGGVTGLMPVTGLTLPFFSAGGSSLFVSMTAAGLLLNVARRATMTDAAGRRRSGGAADRTFAVVTGGGTAGHVLPALAIAEALVDAGHDPSEIHYVGAERGIETRLLPADPVRAHVPRRRRPAARAQPPQRPPERDDGAEADAATRRALALLRRLRPQVVVSVGGYASLPAVLAARRLRVPIVVVSYDRRPGRSSALDGPHRRRVGRRLSRLAAAAGRRDGAPLRRRLLAVDRAGDRVDGPAGARTCPPTASWWP